MKYCLSPETFKVRELFKPQLTQSGAYYYYTLEKKGVSHKQIEKILGVRAWFNGIKDKQAQTIQWFCTQERINEENINEANEEKYTIKFKGQSNTRIHIGGHKGNEFSILVELNEKEQQSLKYFKANKELVCNYFGEQRFSKNSIKIIKELKANNYEQALKVFLTAESKMDSQKSKKIKGIIKSNWGNWERILAEEEIQQTKKVELFEFLKNNSVSEIGSIAFLKAFTYAEPKSLRILIKAWQAMRFNEKLNNIAKEKKPNNFKTKIVDDLEEYYFSASKAFPRKIIIEPNEFEKEYRNSVLERKTFFTAEKFRAKRISENEFELSFVLQRGAYATIFLKFFNSWLEKSTRSLQKD
jgi:TruD family tRNA pseudouridine synthase